MHSAQRMGPSNNYTRTRRQARAWLRLARGSQISDFFNTTTTTTLYISIMNFINHHAPAPVSMYMYMCIHIHHKQIILHILATTSLLRRGRPAPI